MDKRGYGMVLCSDGRMRRVVKAPWYKRLWRAIRCVVSAKGDLT